MKQFKVYKDPSGSTEAVKQGWSWPGFFFCFIWAMLKGMLGLGVGVLVGLVVLFIVILVGAAVIDFAGGEALCNVIAIIVGIIFGVNGNSWFEKNLVSQGFALVDTVTAANPQGAIALHLKGASEER